MKKVNNNRGVFSGWFVPSGQRKRLSFFLSNILLLLLTLIIYGVFGIYFLYQSFLSIFTKEFQFSNFTKEFQFSNSLIFVFLVGLFLLYITIMFIIQRLRDIGVKNNKILIFVFLSLFVIHITDALLFSAILSNILGYVYLLCFLFLLFCPTNYLNRSSK
jgi:uncharacterized membrane protein YhaH (DUF805 family)